MLKLSNTYQPQPFSRMLSPWSASSSLCGVPTNEETDERTDKRGESGTGSVPVSKTNRIRQIGRTLGLAGAWVPAPLEQYSIPIRARQTGMNVCRRGTSPFELAHDQTRPEHSRAQHSASGEWVVVSCYGKIVRRGKPSKNLTVEFGRDSLGHL